MLRDARTGKNYYDVRDYGMSKRMVYYRVAVKAITYGACGTSTKWLFVGPVFVVCAELRQMLLLNYLNPENMVFAGTTPERLTEHLDRFVEGRETVCWSRADFLTGIQTDAVAVQAAEDAIYGTLKGVRFRDPQQRETGGSSALEELRRLEFARWLVETGKLSEDTVCE